MREPINVLPACEGPAAATDCHRGPLVNATEAALAEHQTASANWSRSVIPYSYPRWPAGLLDRSGKAEDFHSRPTGVEAISTECGYAASFIALRFPCILTRWPLPCNCNVTYVFYVLSSSIQVVGDCCICVSVCARICS